MIKQLPNNRAILTFDIEFDEGKIFSKESEKTLFLTLDLLRKYRAGATFFVVGETMEKYPELINRISKEGHEIACHGYSHTRLEDLSPEAFQEGIKKSIELTKSLTGRVPLGFRAPWFSLNQKSQWILGYLENFGFLYDSSLFPMKTPFYGASGVPLSIYPVSKKDFTKVDLNSGLIEVPVSIYKRGMVKIPAAGGVYFRFLPFWLFRAMLRKIQKKRIPVIYLHPHDLYEQKTHLQDPLLLKKIRGWGLKNSFAKFNLLLKEFRFDSIENILFKNEG